MSGQLKLQLHEGKMKTTQTILFKTNVDTIPLKGCEHLPKVYTKLYFRFIKKGKSKLILLLLVPGVVDNLGVEKIREVCIILTQSSHEGRM